MFSRFLQPFLPGSDGARIRQLQIDGLLRSVPTIQIKSHDRSTLHAPVTLPGNRIVYMRIYLPPRYPEDPPDVRMLDQVSHPWIDDQLRVMGHPYLLRWSAQYSLAQLVIDILQQFSVSPPTPIQAFTTPETLSPPSKPAYLRQPSLENPLLIPEIPAIFPELYQLPIERLLHLDDDKEELDAEIASRDDVVTISSMRDEIYESNRKAAEENLSFEDEIRQLKADIVYLREQMRVEKSQVEDLSRHQQQLIQRGSLSSVMDTLHNACTELDMETEDFAVEYIRGDKDIREFIHSFLERRTVYYVRQEKLKLLRSWQ